jgi:hypothetical protein
VLRDAARFARMTILERKAGETRPPEGLGSLHTGWLTVPPGYEINLISIRPAKIQIRIKVGDRGFQGEAEWDDGWRASLLGEIEFRTEPPGIPFYHVTGPATPLTEVE